MNFARLPELLGKPDRRPAIARQLDHLDGKVRIFEAMFGCSCPAVGVAPEADPDRGSGSAGLRSGEKLL